MSKSAQLKTAFQEYLDLEKRTTERQSQWNEQTKDFLLRTLSNLANDLKPLRAVAEESVRNFDSVCLGFKPRPTNIVLKQGAGAKGLIKRGGYLFYGQVFNGKVLVGISYPCVEELQDATPNKAIALLDPEQITEEKIIEHVAQFVKEITEAERSLSADDEIKRRRIQGFAALNDS